MRLCISAKKTKIYYKLYTLTLIPSRNILVSTRTTDCAMCTESILVRTQYSRATVIRNRIVFKKEREDFSK